MANGERRLRVRITGKADAVRRYLARDPQELGRVHVRGDEVEVDLTISQAAAKALRTDDLRVRTLYDADKRGRKAMVSGVDRNRFEGGAIPQGLGLLRRQ